MFATAKDLDETGIILMAPSFADIVGVQEKLTVSWNYYDILANLIHNV